VPPAPTAASEGRIFSDRPIPFAVLRLADADIALTVGSLVIGGGEYRDIAGHLVLANGRLALDPAGARLPAGRLDGRVSADATAEKPPVAVTLRGPGLHAAPLLALLGLPDGIQGDVDVDIDLRGAGDTPHELAASAEGHVGLALVNGQIDNRLVSGTLGRVLQRARLPDVTAQPGVLPVRCLAARFDIQHGAADARALLLDTSLFYVEGGGAVDLGAETLALRLRPLARLGGTGIIVPLRIEGGLRKPKVTVDAAGDASAQKTNGPPLGIIIGALGGNGMVEGGATDDCARQLAVARGGLPGPLPEPAAKPKPPKPADLLRQFLR
jgi:AsmA protein